mmetsp:Transcript_30212/g.55198  ORF Transcript_30212/g.55198 Transcript_30212/m.55198 type:complete len:151 (-) Transcript_30212:379-831(-)|eukprot:CAMPEP_0175039120 /NCGR_PEP_ID=MMETSP0052_2-20121109/343_1 /TAXON_ID=51329 ORGANISM="Polytomella parva, Strain SAG 63-3" /NCGR_SAMPLE_ID=MMETSP0052_2 /ASSEMBLY_ACC=CAM_ASM_000194 /LENGTH=150 /DNA_ID=CAMNT_0016300809 /DNA_START=84 /DNA_END=536 /DNA_ORIENTATION=+
MPGNAFVYGTLMAEEVLNVLLKRVPDMKHASIHDFKRFKIKNQVFPAIIPSPGDVVKGMILLNLTDEELNVLDVYEDEEYYRDTVKPVLEEGMTEVEADVYIWKDKFRNLLLPEEWEYDAWRRDHLQEWLDRLGDSGIHPVGEEGNDVTA